MHGHLAEFENTMLAIYGTMPTILEVPQSDM
jgi:hypothetical protein